MRCNAAATYTVCVPQQGRHADCVLYVPVFYKNQRRKAFKIFGKSNNVKLSNVQPIYILKIGFHCQWDVFTELVNVI